MENKIDIDELLNKQYNELKAKTYKQKADLLYNIAAEKKYFSRDNYHQSLYLDVKQFILNYIKGLENRDYGYDSIIYDKIFKMVSYLPSIQERLSVLYIAKQYFVKNGYNIDDINKLIKDQEITLSLEDHKYLKWALLKVGTSFKGLLIGLSIFVFFIMVVLFPAPFEFMEIFTVELKDYSNFPIFNYFLNAIALLADNENISPSLIPIGFGGLLVYFIGVAIFYILIVNFLFKKIEDYISVHF